MNPFFHTFGYKAGILACLMQGATLVPVDVFDVDRVLAIVASERISVVPGPPTLYQSILERRDRDRDRDRDDLSTLRLAVTGAAVVPVELVKRMGCGARIRDGAHGLRPHRVDRRRHDVQAGRHARGDRIDLGTCDPGPRGARRSTPSAHEVPRGEPGEVVVRGYTVISGYFGNPEATAEAIDEDGWLHTGDVGVMDDDGNLRITDRTKDMYVVGGFNAYPAEVEGMLGPIPG